MIKLQELLPDIYYNHSRDFQFIGRLYDIVLNSVKTNGDLIYNIPLSEDSDERLIDLMSLTLGFKSKHRYNTKQLKAMCSVFFEILRCKGTETAIDTACKALLTAEGITETVEVEIDDSDRTNIIVYIPQELTDINLFKDLLNYILPAGCSCTIVRELKQAKKSDSDFKFVQNAIIYALYNDITGNTQWSRTGGWGAGQVKDSSVSIISQVDTTQHQRDLANILAQGTPGIFINSTIIQPEEIVDTTDAATQNTSANEDENN